MRRLLFLLLAFAVPTFAQRTIVSGTVTDPNFLPYSGATMQVNLSLPTGSLGAYLNGAQISSSAGPVTLDSTGSFVMQLADNTLIQCANAQGQLVTCVPQTQWTFKVTLSPGIAPPLGTGPQFCLSTLTITGSSQSVSTGLSATCPALARASSSGVPQVTGQFNVKDFGAVGDAKLTRAASYTQAGSTITDTTNNPFTSADAGKFITCEYAPNPAALPIFTANGIAQITAVTPPSTVSIAPQVFINGIGTVTGQTCVWYTRDDAPSFCCGPPSAFAAAHTSVSGTLTSGGPTIITSVPKTAITCSGGFAVGGYILNEIEAVTNTLGVSLLGTGCFVYLLPSSTTGLINMQNTAQFTISGLDLSGLGFALATNAGPFINLTNPASFWFNDNRVANWGNSSGACPSTSALLSVASQNGPSLISKNIITGGGSGSGISGCGFLCQGCSSYPTVDNNYIGNNFVNMVFTNGGGRATQGGALVVRNHLGDECGAAFGTACVQETNQTAMFEGGVLFGPGASLSLDATSEADFYGMNVGGFTSAGNFPAVVGAAGSKLVSTNTTIRGNGTGVAIQGPGAGSMTFQDLGGNVMQNCLSTTCTAATIAQTFSGNVNTAFPLTPTATTNLGASQTVSGNLPTGCTVTGNGTSTCAFDTGSTNAAWTITITAAGTTTAVGNVSFTFNPALPSANSSVCTANYTNQGATGTWAIGAISPIFTSNTTTTGAFNINNAGTNLTAGSTYKISGSCYGK